METIWIFVVQECSCDVSISEVLVATNVSQQTDVVFKSSDNVRIQSLVHGVQGRCSVCAICYQLLQKHTQG